MLRNDIAWAVRQSPPDVPGLPYHEPSPPAHDPCEARKGRFSRSLLGERTSRRALRRGRAGRTLSLHTMSAKASPAPRLLTLQRWRVGMAIVAAMAAIQSLPGLLVRAAPRQADSPHLVFGLLLWFVETPILVAVLSWAFDHSTRRRHGSIWVVTRSVLVSVVLGAALFVGFILLGRNQPWLQPGLPMQKPLLFVAAAGGAIGVFVCGIWALAFVLPHVSEQARLRTAEAERLVAEAAQLRAAAEVSRLRSQLEPHFLLNTFNTIAGLVTQDPREARRLIGCLGDLLRDALRDPDEMQTLGAEVTWLLRYTEILSARHGDALTFHWDIEPATEHLLLPHLLLQPLLENAVKHGALRRSAGGGRVEVRAFLDGPRADGGAQAKLVCEVTDNGPGLPSTPPRSGAFGLLSVRRRIALCCPNGSLELKSSSEGTKAIVTLPLLADHHSSPGSSSPPRSPT